MDDTTAVSLSAPEESLPLEPSPPTQLLEEEAPQEVPSGDDTDGADPTYLDEDQYKEIDPNEAPPVDANLEDNAPEQVPELWEFLESNYQPEQLESLSQELAWAHLTDEDGTPNLESIQAIIDQLVDKPGSVLAGDVLRLVAAAEEGVVDLSVLNKEAEHYEQYRQNQEEIHQAKYTQELHERSAKVNEFMQTVNLPERISSAVERFGLMPSEDDSKVARDFKSSVQDRIAYTVDTFAAKNPHLQAVMQMVQEAAQPGRGPTIDQLQTDSIFQISYQRGMQELTDHIGKTLAREAFLNKYIKAGYEALHPQTEEN